MYEGKNIHYSLVDNKPLCSFSAKLCNQRRLNGYAFCVRHILEDPTAPFRRCKFVAKSSQDLCTQAIPLGETRQYCNNHMQVLGMLPRKPKKEKDKNKIKDRESKDKDKEVTVPFDIGVKLSSGSKAKKSAPLSKIPQFNKLPANDDPNDPYAFNDAAHEESPASTSLGSAIEVLSRSPFTTTLPSPSRILGEAIGTMGSLSKAKLYPELAEKLEKIRATPEAKVSRSRVRSSRTMTKLQTKIAQNKIKDKLRKSQESSQSEHSPSQVASPEGMTAALFSPGGFISNSDISSLLGTNSATTLGVAANQLHQLKMSGLVVPGVMSSSVRQPTRFMDFDRLNHGILAKSQILTSKQSLPPPYPGLPRETQFSPPHHSLPAAGPTLTDKVPVVNMPSHGPLSPFMSLSQAPSFPLLIASPAHSISQAPSHESPLHQLSRPLVPHISPVSATSFVVPVDSSDFSSSSSFSPHHNVLNQNMPLSRQASIEKVVSGFPQTSALLSAKPLEPRHQQQQPLNTNQLLQSSSSNGCSMDLPPPPPYIPRSLPFPVPTSAPQNSSVLVTRVQRPRGLLTAKEAKARLKDDLAVKLYAMYVHQRLNNHVFVGSSMSLCTSDEEENSDKEMEDELLPHQIEFRGIPDDEEDNESEEDGELPSDLRMVKLGMMKARHRRHFRQIKHANRINTKVMTSRRLFTLELLKLARKNPSTAALTLSAIHHKPVLWPGQRKSRPKPCWKKVCTYKDGAGRQCNLLCLPYVNHCRKHVMYNIDQQLFQFCLAKNSDNTQCCMPVIDLLHDPPLCFPHALESEKRKKEEVAEMKKRPRKKTKPPALTRPPRKGKKKKGKNVRPQKPLPPDKPTGDIAIPESTMDLLPAVLPEPNPITPPLVAPVLAAAPEAAATCISELVKMRVAPPVSSAPPVRPKDGMKPLEQPLGSVDMEDTLSPDFDKPFELPLEQASRLLEDDAFDNFPDDAFQDIFAMADKNGESLEEENKKLEQQLAEVTNTMFQKAKVTLDKLLKGDITMDDVEDTTQLAEVIAQHLPGLVDPHHDMNTSLAAQSLDLFSTPVSYAPISQGNSRMSAAPVPSYPTPGLPTSVTLNGLMLGGVGLPSSLVYNQALLGSGTSGIYTGTTTSIQDTHLYGDDHLSQGYTLTQAAQTQHDQEQFVGLQGVPSVLTLLGGGSREISLSQQLTQPQQQQTHLTRGMSVGPVRTSVSVSTAPSLHVLGVDQHISGLLSAQHQQVPGGVVHSPSAGAISHSSSLSSLGTLTQSTVGSQACVSINLQNPSTVSSMVHLSASNVPVSVNAHNTAVVHSSQGPLITRPQEGLSLVGPLSRPQEGLSPVGLVSVHQLQGLSGWDLSRQSTLGYHTLNGFPAAVMQQTYATTVPQSTASSQVKYVSSLPQDICLPGGVGSNEPPTPAMAKHEIHSAMIALAPSPRLSALSQQHARSLAGSPGFGHSPSPPAHSVQSPGGLNSHLAAHSPQSLNQSLAAAMAYQGSSSAS